MSRLLKVLGFLLALNALLVVFAIAMLAASTARPGATWDVDGVGARIEIRFDENLRPYVDAGSLDDALFAEGWLHARYRLWQMELLRRAGQGRLAEGLGEDMLDTDISLWRAGVPQLAERLEQQASSETLGRVDAYVAGINAALDTYPVRPIELILTRIDPRPWNRRDVFAVGAIIAFQSANNMEQERLRLSIWQELEPDKRAVFLPDETLDPGFPYVIRERELIVLDDFIASLDAFEQRLMPNASLGSSSWAVGASRSSTGNTLFAFDSHDALNLPNLFYEVHLFYGPEKSVRGWSLPGLPGVINGFNHHIAWGLTNIGDTQDLYLETRHATDALQFELDGDWYTARTETIEIPVAGRESPHRFSIVHTVNGPLIDDDNNIALCWTGHDLAGRGMEALLAMNTAENWEQFEAAINQHAAPSANVAYADRSGRIASRTIGLLPERGNGDGLLPLAGNDSANQWTGYIPDEELPSLVDPEIGYVAAANARVHAGDPLVSAENAAGYRMRRLHSMLESDGSFTLDDMSALQLDTFNSQADRLLPFMLPPRAALNQDIESQPYDVLRSWQDMPLNDAHSAGALIWEHWYIELAKTVFAGALTPEDVQGLLGQNYMLNHALDRLITDDHESPWWQGRREALLRESFAATVGRISENYGNDPAQWRWDAALGVSFRHELGGVSSRFNRGPYPWGGGNPTLGRARYKYSKPFEARAGATVRVVAEMADPMRVRAVIPGGQHGNAWSRHYDDQIGAWLAGELFELADSPQDVDGTVTLLEPM